MSWNQFSSIFIFDNLLKYEIDISPTWLTVDIKIIIVNKLKKETLIFKRLIKRIEVIIDKKNPPIIPE